MTEEEGSNLGKISAGGEGKDKAVFRPSWLFGTEEEMKGLQLDPNSKFGKAVIYLHNTPKEIIGEEQFKNIGYNIFNLALEEQIPEDVYGFVTGRLSDLILNLDKQEAVDDKREAKRVITAQELPLHIGAVFKGGRNELQIAHESIPVLDIKDENDRFTYIFENLHAFNKLFNQPLSWKGAVDIWLSDALIARQTAERDGDSLLPGEYSEFEKRLKAAMAVTASARLMELSGGDCSKYLAGITGGGEQPDSGKQDEWAEFLLHGDPEKLRKVLELPMVREFYSRILTDAGLIDNGDEGLWAKRKDAFSEKEEWMPGVIRFEQGAEGGRQSVIAGYLKDFGEKGGLEAYIEEILLKQDVGRGFTNDSRWAAARLACDVFLTDVYTRWEYVVTNAGEQKLDFQPSLNWGGNPLFFVLLPSFLPRLKNVYSHNPLIYDWIDSSFRPLDIFTGDLKGKMLIPSMAVNLKRLHRYNTALSLFLGGAMSEGLPRWDNEMMNKGLPTMVSMLDQLYGGIKDKNKEEVGKEIVAAMTMRALYTKVVALVSESDQSKLAILTAPSEDKRPYYSTRAFLFGPRLDGREGFIKQLVSPREGLKLKNNRFSAEKTLKDLARLLTSKDGSSFVDNARFVLDILSAFSRK